MIHLNIDWLQITSKILTTCVKILVDIGPNVRESNLK